MVGCFEVTEKENLLCFTPASNLPLCSNVYLIGGDTLIDLGNPLYTRDIVDTLIERKIYPKDIRRILLTHLHFDHVGDPSIFTKAEVFASRECIESYERNPGAAVWINYARDGRREGAAGAAFIENVSAGKIRLQTLDDALSDLTFSSESLKAAQSNGGGFFVMNGHAKGSTSFIFNEGIFVGDCYGHRKSPTATLDCLKKRFINYIRNYALQVYKGHDDHDNYSG